MSNGKIPLTDDELKLIISTIDFRMKKILKHNVNAPAHEVEQATVVLDRLGPLSYKLRTLRKDFLDNH